MLTASQGAAQVSAQQPRASHDQAIYLKFPDITWDKIVPELGDRSPEIAILHVDPSTQATKLMIRVPKDFHVPKHWHTANETHTIVSGTFIMQQRRTAGGVGAGFVQRRAQQGGSPSLDEAGGRDAAVHHGGWRMGCELGRWSAPSAGQVGRRWSISREVGLPTAAGMEVRR